MYIYIYIYIYPSYIFKHWFNTVNKTFALRNIDFQLKTQVNIT